MERLTFEGNFCDIAMCRENPCPYNGSCSQKETWERLKAYEDTGLTPEEIERIVDAYGRGHTLRSESALRLEIIRDIETDQLRELAQAEKEGRLLVLPCKVGDTVYRICREYKKGNPFIRAVTFNQNNFWRIVFCGEFGKTVFLTREEADAALKGEGDG